MKLTDYTFPLRTEKIDGTKVEIKEVHFSGFGGSGAPMKKPVIYRAIKRGRPSWKDADISEFIWPSGLSE